MKVINLSTLIQVAILFSIGSTGYVKAYAQNMCVNSIIEVSLPAKSKKQKADCMVQAQLFAASSVEMQLAKIENYAQTASKVCASSMNNQILVAAEAANNKNTKVIDLKKIDARGITCVVTDGIVTDAGCNEVIYSCQFSKATLAKAVQIEKKEKLEKEKIMKAMDKVVSAMEKESQQLQAAFAKCVADFNQIRDASAKYCTSVLPEKVQGWISSVVAYMMPATNNVNRCDQAISTNGNTITSLQVCKVAYDDCKESVKSLKEMEVTKTCKAKSKQFSNILDSIKDTAVDIKAKITK